MKQRIYETKCRRCGKPIFTTRQSLLGMDNLKVKYGGICEACMPKDEQYQMLKEMGEVIVGKIGQRGK